jgi:hypothetical protein
MARDMAYVKPSQEVLDLLLAGRSCEMKNYAQRNGIPFNEDGIKDDGQVSIRVIAPGWILDSHNPGPVLHVRPQGVKHDHWLQYDSRTGLLEVQTEDGWDLVDFDDA